MRAQREKTEPKNGAKSMTRESFEALYKELYEPLVQWYHSTGIDYHAAEDTAQETFLRLWKQAGNIGEKHRRYVFVVSRNEWRRELAAAARRKKFEDEVLRPFWKWLKEKGYI